MESGDNIMVDVRTLSETFLNMSLRSACFTDEIFSDKQNFRSWDYCPQVSDHQDF